MRPLQNETQHGCGHYWLCAVITWDEGVEIREGWVYDPVLFGDDHAVRE